MHRCDPILNNLQTGEYFYKDLLQHSEAVNYNARQTGWTAHLAEQSIIDCDL